MKTNLISWLIKIDDEDVLARIWCELNSWTWPKDIPEAFKPQWWDGVQYQSFQDIQNRKHGFDGPIMDYIAAKIPKKKIDEWWMKPVESIDSAP